MQLPWSAFPSAHSDNVCEFHSIVLAKSIFFSHSCEQTVASVCTIILCSWVCAVQCVMCMYACVRAIENCGNRWKQENWNFIKLVDILNALIVFYLILVALLCLLSPHIYSVLNFSLTLRHMHTHTSTSCAWFLVPLWLSLIFLSSAYRIHIWLALVSFSHTIRCQCGMLCRMPMKSEKKESSQVKPYQTQQQYQQWQQQRRSWNEDMVISIVSSLQFLCSFFHNLFCSY